MSRLKGVLFWVCVAATINDLSHCCTYDEMDTGCRLSRSTEGSSPGRLECLCGIGCNRDFPYKTRAECQASLESGRAFASDPCASFPCQNSGECIQTKFGGFRCECAGTNHHGESCEKECPEKMAPNAYGYQDPNFPLDCIKI